VFLGSSLSECAFNNSSSFEKKLSKNEKHKSRVLKVVIHSLNNKIIRELRFFDFITKVRQIIYLLNRIILILMKMVLAKSSNFSIIYREYDFLFKKRDTNP
jgi:hypothetical protein